MFLQSEFKHRAIDAERGNVQGYGTVTFVYAVRRVGVESCS